jgi:hypothetical protein
MPKANTLNQPRWEGQYLDCDKLIPFKMYLVNDIGPNRDALKNRSTHHIEGIIEDEKYGKATFEGKVSLTFLKFYKKYTDEAIQKGASGNKIVYEGKKVNGIWVGTYKRFDEDLINPQYCVFWLKLNRRH